MKTRFTLMMALLTMLAFQTKAQWTVCNTGNSNKNLWSVAFSGNNGVIGGDNGLTIYTSDGGQTWTSSFQAPYDAILSGLYLNPTTALMGTSGKIMKSVNSGSTFTYSGLGISFGDVRDLLFTSPTTGYAIDDNCAIALTTDGGATWTAGTSPCSGIPRMNDIDFPTASVGYWCGNNGNVFKTTDAGAHWAAVTAPGNADVNYFNMQFFDANTGLIIGHSSAGNDSMVFRKTTDGGTTWTDMGQYLMASGVSPNVTMKGFSFANASVGYAIGDNKIYKTTDGGMSWTLDYTDPVHTNTFNRVQVFPNIVIALGPNGTAVRTAGLGTGISEVKPANTITVYPNPASGSITIGSFLVNNSKGFVTLTDISGRIVKAESLSSNEIDISTLNNGIYFGDLRNAEGTQYTFNFVKE